MAHSCPTPMCVSLEVTDLSSSAKRREQVLGFPVMCSTRRDVSSLVLLRRERYQDMLPDLSPRDGPNQRGEGVTIQYQAGDDGVDQIARTARAAGLERVKGNVARIATEVGPMTRSGTGRSPRGKTDRVPNVARNSGW